MNRNYNSINTANEATKSSKGNGMIDYKSDINQKDADWKVASVDSNSATNAITDDKPSSSESSKLLAPSTNPRTSFLLKDARASKIYHDSIAIRLKAKDSQAMASKEMHGSGGIFSDYIKSIVYGGVDGLITTFATVTSVAGGGLSPSVILILGIAHLFADGISMGSGDAMSSQAENDLISSELDREKWEMENNLQGEIDEMVELYMDKGIQREDALNIIQTMAKYPQFFLDHMMVQELGMMPPDEQQSPLKSGIATMLAFTLFGCVPLIPYLLALIPGANMSELVQLSISVIATILTLFILGSIKGVLIDKYTQSSWWKSGLMMTLNGSMAAVLGYVIGYGMQQLIGTDTTSLEMGLPPT